MGLGAGGRRGPLQPTVFALIGRDVLEHCTLFYNGPRRELTLSH